MSQPYYGEIRMFGGNFPPLGWAFCNGQLLSISQNDVLFTIIGTTYGGDGQTTFGLPDLRGRVPVHMGTGGGGSYVIGQLAGVESVTLALNQLPIHSHIPQASSTGGDDSPVNNFWAKSTTGKPYANGTGGLAMNTGTVQPAGGSQPHNNMVPFLCVSYVISLSGVFPSP